MAAFELKGLSQPIGRLKTVMEVLARNDLKAEIPGVERRDELGEMARTVEVFKKNGIEVERLKVEQLGHGQVADAKERSVRSSKPYPRPQPNWKLPRER